MTDKEFVLNRFPDARIVYGASGKPSVMSDIFTYQSKTGTGVNEAWENAANDIKSLNFAKRYFNDKETVIYFWREPYIVNKAENDYIVPHIGVRHSSETEEGAWAEAALLCKEQYEFWSKKKWDDV